MIEVMFSIYLTHKLWAVLGRIGTEGSTVVTSEVLGTSAATLWILEIARPGIKSSCLGCFM